MKEELGCADDRRSRGDNEGRYRYRMARRSVTDGSHMHDAANRIEARKEHTMMVVVRHGVKDGSLGAWSVEE